MKKIAFIINSLNSGGAERVLSTLANSLIGKYQISIITFTNTPPFYPLDSKIEVFPCKEKISPSNNILEALKTNYQLYLRIREICKEISPDILVAFMTTANVLGTLAAKSFGVPIIISERNNPNMDYTPFFWKIMKRITYPNANKLIVQTELIKNFYSTWIKESKIAILPNPISSIHIDYRKKYSLKRENIILSVGRLSFQKGQDVAIKSFASLNPPNWKLHIIGEGPDRQKLNDLIQELKMQDKIILLGRRKNISEYYLKSKIFVFPSRFEGFPNALIEAMYFGLACISANCPTGPSELIKHGDNGFLFETDNVEEISGLLSLLIEKEGVLSKIGDKAYNSLDHLEEENVVSKWKALIDDNLNKVIH
ncbi:MULTISPECIES: glycosyltransferase family 4 protein [Maribacter]|uniref:Glycosyltransferase family 4 protein n=1 Tax=Maribacter flavus TaxID=1658664 RepID=A0ABU7IJS9_9FLAO|nr:MULTISPECIES: glycosyltransferase family 4 protein [Maribacter]MDC6405687.1 glycosyltransferase family 4 protein [Maribacter sp. PR66]MEE1973061.1 glycosyltransferase family 4 protein [Maribacter flavus]